MNVQLKYGYPIRIEPDWNVKLTDRVYKTINFYPIRIEPDWNVKYTNFS